MGCPKQFWFIACQVVPFLDLGQPSPDGRAAPSLRAQCLGRSDWTDPGWRVRGKSDAVNRVPLHRDPRSDRLHASVLAHSLSVPDGNGCRCRDRSCQFCRKSRRLCRTQCGNLGEAFIQRSVRGTLRRRRLFAFWCCDYLSFRPANDATAP